MSFPSGPPGGYPGRPPQQQGGGYGPPPVQRANPLADLSRPSIVTLVVLVFGLASYFCSFTSNATSLDIQVMLLLAGGLLAGLHVLPKAPKTLPFAAVLSAVGGLSVLADVIQTSSGGITIIILVLGLLQFLVSAFALLLEYELIKLAPRPAVPYVAPGTFPQSGPFPQTQHGPGHHGQAQQAPQQGQQQGQPQGQASQATHYVAAPQQSSAPAPQSTMFLQQPGQITHQQPGTPSDGFPGPS
jgi:Family of unknown function (DUF5336)